MVSGHAATKPTVLRVGVIEKSDPIAFKSEQGDYLGIAIDMWRSIAQKNQWRYQFIPTHQSIDDSLRALSQGKYDIVLGPVSVTHERLRFIDYSRPYFMNKVGVAVQNAHTTFWQTLHAIFGPVLFEFGALFIVLFMIFSFALWLAEGRHSPQIGTAFFSGIGHSMWATITSFLRDVLYDPVTLTGRVILGLWLLVSVVYMAAIASVITSSLTVSISHQTGMLSSPSDLNEKLIGVEQGTSNVRVAEHLGAKLVLHRSFAKSLKELDAGNLNGVLGDYYLLWMYIKKHPTLKLHMSPIHIMNDEFAFAVPQGSPLLRQLNLSITQMQDTGLSNKLCKEYINTKAHACEL